MLVIGFDIVELISSFDMEQRPHNEYAVCWSSVKQKIFFYEKIASIDNEKKSHLIKIFEFIKKEL